MIRYEISSDFILIHLKSENYMYLVDMNFTDMTKITPELTDQHKNYLTQEYKSNKLMFGGRKVPRTGGILISQHESESELKQVLNSDPFVKSGAVTYSITEFIPVMASKAYENIVA
jgi:uncharacterized protein YciI